jgi:hypothetical protein
VTKSWPLLLALLVLGEPSCLADALPATANPTPTLTLYLEGDFLNPKCHYVYSATPDGVFRFEINYPDDDSRVWFESTISGRGTLYPPAVGNMLKSLRTHAFFDLPEQINSGSRAKAAEYHLMRISDGHLTREVRVDGSDSADPAALRFWRLWSDLVEAFPASPRQIPMGSTRR